APGQVSPAVPRPRAARRTSTANSRTSGLALKSQHQAVRYAEHVQQIEPPLKIAHSAGAAQWIFGAAVQKFCGSVNPMELSIRALLVLAAAWIDTLRHQHKIIGARCAHRRQIGSRRTRRS